MRLFFVSDILLIYPEPSKESPQRNPALSIFYGGASCEQKGYNVDYFVEGIDSLSILNNKISKSTIIGISSMMGYQWKRSKEIIKKIRSISKTKPIVLGGIMATILPDEAEKYVNCCVKGEGENSLLEYMKNLSLKRINAPLIDFRKEYVSPITNKTEKYFYDSAKRNSIIFPTSRGCFSKCGFCVVNNLYCGKWRDIGFDKWKADIEKIYLLYPFTYFELNDENFMPTPKRIEKYGTFLGNLNLDWHLHARADSITPDIAKDLKKFGCSQIHIGAESGNNRILSLVGKNITVSKTKESAEILSGCKIKTTYTFMMGLPTETKNEFLDTLNFMDDLYKIHKGYCRMTLYEYQPLNGTPLYLKYGKGNTLKAIYNNIYYISGLNFNRGENDKTDKNFPNKWRLLIKPFEFLCKKRWERKFFYFFGIEKILIKFLFIIRRKMQ